MTDCTFQKGPGPTYSSRMLQFPIKRQLLCLPLELAPDFLTIFPGTVWCKPHHITSGVRS